MMGPGISSSGHVFKAGTKALPERCHHCRASRGQKNLSGFCPNMKQHINFIVPYWNMNSHETVGLRSRSAPSTQKKATNRTIVGLFQRHGRQERANLFLYADLAAR